MTEVTVANAVIGAIEEIVEPDQVDVEASEESHVVAEELRLPMSTTNRLSHLWAKKAGQVVVYSPIPSNHICGKNKKKVTNQDASIQTTLKKKRSFCWTNMISSPNLRSNHHTCKIFASDEKNTCVINPKKKICHLKKKPSNQRPKKQSSCVFPPLPINKIISSDSQPFTATFRNRKSLPAQYTPLPRPLIINYVLSTLYTFSASDQRSKGH